MVLKIEKTRSALTNVLTLSGRISSDAVQTLKASLDDAQQPIALDLDQIDLINLDAARFLAALERGGIELRNCRPHVRAWIAAEKRRIGGLET